VVSATHSLLDLAHAAAQHQIEPFLLGFFGGNPADLAHGTPGYLTFGKGLVDLW